jgi:hypothetical protein
MIALLLVSQFLVSWTPPSQCTDGSPCPPAGTELSVTLRTILADGRVSEWTAPVSLLKCEPDFALNGSVCVRQTCRGCH